MQAIPFQFPAPELFKGDPQQLPLFLFQVKLRFSLDATLEDIPEEEKVFIAIGYLRGRAFACFKRYLGDFLSNEEGHRKIDTDEMFGNFQVFEDRLRLLFGTPDEEARGTGTPTVICNCDIPSSTQNTSFQCKRQEFC